MTDVVQSIEQSTTIHGSAVALRDRGVLILGASGTGKTTLAVEMVARGAELVADDWVLIERGRAVGLVMSPPKPIAGLVELSGIGLIRLPFVDQAPLTFVADLDHPAEQRLPHPMRRPLLGTSAPVICCQGKAGLASALIAVLRAGGLLDPEFFAK